MYENEASAGDLGDLYIEPWLAYAANTLHFVTPHPSPPRRLWTAQRSFHLIFFVFFIQLPSSI